jgi:hypothetical protein
MTEFYSLPYKTNSLKNIIQFLLLNFLTLLAIMPHLDGKTNIYTLAFSTVLFLLIIFGFYLYLNSYLCRRIIILEKEILILALKYPFSANKKYTEINYKNIDRAEVAGVFGQVALQLKFSPHTEPETNKNWLQELNNQINYKSKKNG